jgi:hypothetical protein
MMNYDFCFFIYYSIVLLFIIHYSNRNKAICIIDFLLTHQILIPLQ